MSANNTSRPPQPTGGWPPPVYGQHPPPPPQQQQRFNPQWEAPPPPPQPRYAQPHPGFNLPASAVAYLPPPQQQQQQQQESQHVQPYQQISQQQPDQQQIETMSTNVHVLEFAHGGGSGVGMHHLLFERDDHLRAYYDAREAALKKEHAAREETLKREHAAREETLKQELAAREEKLQNAHEAKVQELEAKIAELQAWANDSMTALNTGASASIRTAIEKYAADFQNRHVALVRAGHGACKEDLTWTSTTGVLNHYAKCLNIQTRDLLGVELTAGLHARGIQPPSMGSFKGAFEELSDIIHNATVQVDGKYVLPAQLTRANMRFVARFLQARGDDVLIGQANGRPRMPKPDEQVTPPRSPQQGASAPRAVAAKRGKGP